MYSPGALGIHGYLLAMHPRERGNSFFLFRYNVLKSEIQLGLLPSDINIRQIQVWIGGRGAHLAKSGREGETVGDERTIPLHDSIGTGLDLMDRLDARRHFVGRLVNRVVAVGRSEESNRLDVVSHRVKL